MEKIRVQFKESEYEIYQNYCLRYFTIYDTTRKRSIQLFLELFEKDLLPVDEHDLGEVFSFFSNKCEELHADSNVLEKTSSLTDIPQFQICRDMLFLIQDFEKIYHLIEKKGITSNYVLILATFSKIIEEGKNAYIFAINEQDRLKIEVFAPRIADIIRARLGPGAGWESVLYELTRIVKKFNHTSPDQKISQNAIFLLGSAVVSYFDSSVGAAEIQSTLQRYFEAGELAEFESLLNNTPYLPEDDTDSDISIQVIFDALISISRRETDQGYREPVSDSGLLTIAGILPVILPSVRSRKSEAFTPLMLPYTPYTHKIKEISFSRFDIDVGDTVNSIVVVPKKRDNPPYNVYMKPGMPQASFMIMGFVILVLFAITLAATSGIWSPVNTMGNSNASIPGNVSNPVNAMANSSTGIAGSTSIPAIFQKSPSQLVINQSQSQDTVKQSIIVVTPTPPARLSSSDISKNFMRIAFGLGNTRIEKIANERISVAITGAFDDNDYVIIKQFKDTFNAVADTSQFVNEIKSNDKADIVVTFLDESSLKNIGITESRIISKNRKTGEINYMQETVQTQNIMTKYLYINSDYKGKQRTHWILRGLLSELGLVGETDDYQDSIFYSGSETTDQLSDLDWKVVELMYSKKITTGMTFDRVRTLLLV